jgi:hypothetical protein
MPSGEPESELPPRKAINKPLFAGIALIVLSGLIVLIVVVAQQLSEPREKSLYQRVNEDASSINVGIDPIHGAQPGFEFHMNEAPPRFSFILCTGPSDDPRLNMENWYGFVNEVLKYGPATGYKPEMQEAGEQNGRKISRFMMYVTLHEGHPLLHIWLLLLSSTISFILLRK